MNEEHKNLFELKIQPILEYIGAIGATFMCVAYIIIIFVLINGFEVHKMFQTTVFAVVSAVVGLVIMEFLKIQGQAFAENLPENKKILDEYYNTKTKDKKLHNMFYFWWMSVIKDVLFKAGSVAITTIGMIYIIIEGSNDWNMLLLAVVNLIMFLCFGLLGLNKAYNFYNNQHIPYIKEQIRIKKEEDNKHEQ